MIGSVERGEVALGREAPDVVLLTTDGQAVRLSDFKGHPVVLGFSSEWDPSWPQQLALYNSVLHQLPGGGQLVGVSCDGVWCELDVQDEAKVRFPLLRGISSVGETATLFGVFGGQAIFVIDAEGVVRWKHLAPTGVHPTAEQLRDAIESIGMQKEGVSRRQFLVTAVAASFALAVLPSLACGSTPSAVAQGSPAGQEKPANVKTISLHVNGQNHQVVVEPRVTLLDALRERIGLTGTKKGCDHGQCGACTVHMNGRRVNSCLVLAMQAEGATISTIEGLAHGDHLHPVQDAFIKHDGFQCGYCTPGQIMSAVACIQEGHANTDEDIKEWMSGNLCRCGAYPGICDAIKEARQQMGGAK